MHLVTRIQTGARTQKSTVTPRLVPVQMLVSHTPGDIRGVECAMRTPRSALSDGVNRGEQSVWAPEPTRRLDTLPVRKQVPGVPRRRWGAVASRHGERT